MQVVNYNCISQHAIPTRLMPVAKLEANERLNRLTENLFNVATLLRFNYFISEQ